MDHLAGKHVRQLIFNNRNTTKTTFLPSQQIAVCIKKEVTVSNIDDKLRGSFYKNNIIQHYQNTVGLSDTLFDQINWDAIHLATRNHVNRNQILKCVHNQWPTMTRSFKWQQSNTDICQMCNDHSESWQHILRCSYLHMSRARTTSISKIKNELLILKTNPTLINHFMHIITTWTDNSNPLPPPIDFQPYRNEIRQANFAQQQIGFDLFMKGMLDRRWQRIQEKHINAEHLSKKCNIKRWIKRVSEILLEHCVSCYKERCTIINAENQNAYETHTRNKAYELLLDIKANAWKISHDNTHLLARSKTFFFSSPM